MGAGLKKDLRVSRVGPGGSLNAFFFLLIGVISQRLARVRKRGGTSTLGERSTTESCMLRSGRMNRMNKWIGALGLQLIIRKKKHPASVLLSTCSDLG
ncbi:hypothetical protein PHJA_001858400 [Phtheirospermum japonicum]|uniref:Uncharacterized protein n=1 Tax=Phtheirospermum japonicum TaxID=374723 RepID=A0A830CMT0_9LAMI|nr:hypothetical protein PHJA_001858400 [Phtheirospermum japonicum]